MQAGFGEEMWPSVAPDPNSLYQASIVELVLQRTVCAVALAGTSAATATTIEKTIENLSPPVTFILSKARARDSDCQILRSELFLRSEEAERFALSMRSG